MSSTDLSIPPHPPTEKLSQLNKMLTELEQINLSSPSDQLRKAKRLSVLALRFFRYELAFWKSPCCTEHKELAFRLSVGMEFALGNQSIAQLLLRIELDLSTAKQELAVSGGLAPIEIQQKLWCLEEELMGCNDPDFPELNQGNREFLNKLNQSRYLY